MNQLPRSKSSKIELDHYVVYTAINNAIQVPVFELYQMDKEGR